MLFTASHHGMVYKFWGMVQFQLYTSSYWPMLTSQTGKSSLLELYFTKLNR